MSTTIYAYHGYIISRSVDGYIAYNTRKEFKCGHTHLKSFKTAKYIIQMAYHERIPRHLSNYLLVSLMRISDNEKYISDIRLLLENKKKKELYVNVNKGVKT